MATIDATAYAAVASAYADCAQLHVESLAALAILMERGRGEAVILLRWLGGDAAVSAVLGPGRRRPTLVEDDDGEENDGDDEGAEEHADELRAEIAPRLTAAIADATAVTEGAGRTCCWRRWRRGAR